MKILHHQIADALLEVGILIAPLRTFSRILRSSKLEVVMYLTIGEFGETQPLSLSLVVQIWPV
jgi:hypothetical protein